MHWKHKWSQWKIIAKGDLTYWSSTQQKSLRDGGWFTQERKCESCGKVERTTKEI